MDAKTILEILRDAGGWGLAAISIWFNVMQYKRNNTISDKMLEVIINVTAVVSSLKYLVEHRKGD